jgi:YD repeat-containing protein
MPLLFILAIACDDENGAEVPVVCLPTELHAEEALMKITYNDQSEVAFIEYEEYDNPQNSTFKSIHTYTNSKISVIDQMQDAVKEAYHSFEYTDNTIVENHFSKIGTTSNFEKTEFITYYIQNNRVTKSVSKEIQFTGYDSAIYTYDAKGNIIHSDHFNNNNVKEYTFDYEYDDKINPYEVAGVNGGDGEYFNIENLSTNNVVKAVYKDVASSDTETEIITYTYDAEGKPITRKFDWDTIARAFKYECK